VYSKIQLCCLKLTGITEGPCSYKLPQLNNNVPSINKTSQHPQTQAKQQLHWHRKTQESLTSLQMMPEDDSVEETLQPSQTAAANIYLSCGTLQMKLHDKTSLQSTIMS